MSIEEEKDEAHPEEVLREEDIKMMNKSIDSD